MKNKMGYQFKRDGWMFIEVMISIAVLGILLTGFWAFQSHLADFNRRSLAMERCRAAAQAQLESISVTGQPITADLLQEVWPGVETSFTQAPGEGDWAGLTQLSVQATVMLNEREINAVCVRYVPDREVQP